MKFTIVHYLIVFNMSAAARKNDVGLKQTLVDVRLGQGMI